MSDATSKPPLRESLLALWRAFDGTPVPGVWVGRSDAMILPALEQVSVRDLPDQLGMSARADLFGVANVDGEVYAWVGVLHEGPGPADDRVVDRLFDAAQSELAHELSRFDGVVPWLLSPRGIKADARARLLEVGALFSGRADVRNLLESFGIEAELGE